MPLRIPHFVRPLSLLAVTGLFLAGGDSASAQRHNNFQQLNSQFSTGSATGVFLEPDQVMGTGLTGADGSSSKFIGRLPGTLTSQLNTGFSETLPSINHGLTGSHSNLSSKSFSGSTSSLNGDMDSSPMWRSNFPLGRNFPMKMAPAADTRQPQMSSTLQRNSSLNDATAYDRWKKPAQAPDKFTDAFVFHTTDNSKQLQQVGQELSLQDINRYQFQGEFSSEPGLPITRAGGDSNAVTTTGGQLLHSPKLFDLNPTNTIPSGGAISPRIITSEGSEPYLPGTPASSGTAPRPVQQNISAPAGQTPSRAQTNQEVPASTSTTRSEIPKHEAVLPQGKYQFTTPGGTKVPVEVDAPEITTDIGN
jgi:hypothetical protein